MKKEIKTIVSAHGFIRPSIKPTSKKYRAEYGIPDYTLYLGEYADTAIRKLYHEGYTVLVGASSGKNYILTPNFLLVSLDGRSVLPLASYEYDEIILDNITKIARIWIEA